MRTPNYECVICGKMHYQRPNIIRAAKHGLCCSMSCSSINRSRWSSGKGNHQYGLKGSLNASFKSNERESVYGYILVRSPEHHRANCDGFVFKHILMAEELLGRDLLDGEVVHHIDLDKKNNSYDNLKVMSKADHTALHNRLSPRERGIDGRFISVSTGNR